MTAIACSPTNEAVVPAKAIPEGVIQRLQRIQEVRDKLELDERENPASIQAAEASFIGQLSDEDASRIITGYAALRAALQGNGLKGWSAPEGIEDLPRRFSKIPYFSDLVANEHPAPTSTAQSGRNGVAAQPLVTATFDLQCAPPTCNTQAVLALVATFAGDKAIELLLNKIIGSEKVAHLFQKCVFEGSCNAREMAQEAALLALSVAGGPMLKMAFIVYQLTDTLVAASNYYDGTLEKCQRLQDSSECQCAAPGMKCGGACVDTENSPQHCGDCNNACDPGAICECGKCNGPLLCRGTYVSECSYPDKTTRTEYVADEPCTGTKVRDDYPCQQNTWDYYAGTSVAIAITECGNYPQGSRIVCSLKRKCP